MSKHNQEDTKKNEKQCTLGKAKFKIQPESSEIETCVQSDGNQGGLLVKESLSELQHDGVGSVADTLSMAMDTPQEVCNFGSYRMSQPGSISHRGDYMEWS